MRTSPGTPRLLLGRPASSRCRRRARPRSRWQASRSRARSRRAGPPLRSAETPRTRCRRCRPMPPRRTSRRHRGLHAILGSPPAAPRRPDSIAVLSSIATIATGGPNAVMVVPARAVRIPAGWFGNQDMPAKRLVALADAARKLIRALCQNSAHPTRTARDRPWSSGPLVGGFRVRRRSHERRRRTRSIVEIRRTGRV